MKSDAHRKIEEDRSLGSVGGLPSLSGFRKKTSATKYHNILMVFIIRTFPYEFYQEIFRLKGWPGPDGQKRPIIIAQYTNDFIYARLAPGVLDELKRINPTMPTGRRRHLQYRWFTPDPGYTKLNQHIAAVMALMRASANWNIFQRNLNRAFPKLNETIPMPFEEE